MKLYSFLALLCFTNIVVAQDTLRVSSNLEKQAPKKIRYFGYLQTGALIACNSCQGGQQITTTSAIVQGITLGNRLRIGAGVGIDSYYGWHVMPLFGSLEVDMIKINPRHAVVFQFQYGGGAIARLNDQYKNYGYANAEAGRMVFPQIGYRMHYHDLKLGLLVGFKYQRLSSRHEYPVYPPTFIGPAIVNDYNRTLIEESYSRFAVAVQVGWR